MEKKKLNRLESLDVLRGFDLFCLVVLEMVLHPLAHAIDMPWFNSFMCHSALYYTGYHRCA